MEIQGKLHADDILNLYEAPPKLEYEVPVEIERLSFFDKSLFFERLKMVGAQAWKQYSSGRSLNRQSSLIVETVDEKVPLIVEVDYRPADNAFSVALYRANLETYKRMGSKISSALVGELIFKIEGNTFDLGHRVTAPQFARQGIGLAMSKCAENFLQERANDTQAEQGIEVETAQVDTITWLWNQGYRPQSLIDQEKFYKIIAGNEDLCLGYSQYIFPKSVPLEERHLMNMGNAFRLRLEKRLPPQTSETLDGTLNNFKKSIQGV